MFNFNEGPEKYYGFYFMGENHKSKLAQTYLPVDQLGLEHLLQDSIGYIHDTDFKVIFGFVKELGLLNGKVVLNSPSKVGEKKFQAFIFKRKNEEVKGEGNNYFINGIRIDFNFIQYDVNIIEIDD